MVSEREERLHDEHDRLIAENDGLRRRLEQLRRENEFLQEEAERVRVESQEYLLYVGKRSQRRQDAIISLNDQNTRELEDIRKQKEKLEVSFQEKEKKMRDQLLERETELANLRKELKELEPMKEIQKEQISLIRQLESEVMASRGKHAESLLRVKSAFLRQKVECQQDSERQLNQLSQKAHEEAKNVLQDVSPEGERREPNFEAGASPAYQPIPGPTGPEKEAAGAKQTVTERATMSERGEVCPTKANEFMVNNERPRTY